MEVQDIHYSLGKWGCLIFCYLWEANVDVDITKHFNRLVELGIIDSECFVRDGNRLLKYFGSEKRVAPGVNNRGNTIVPYRLGRDQHFVVVNNRGEIVFSGLGNSQCVRLGEPVWAKARYLE